MVSPPVVPDEALDALESEVGDDLRAVISYGDRSYEEHYVRSDVDEAYGTEEIQQFIDDLSMQGLSQSHLQSLFNAGPLKCTVFGFEDALMFHFVINDLQGLFVTYDRTPDSDITSFIHTCETYVAPALQ